MSRYDDILARLRGEQWPRKDPELASAISFALCGKGTADWAYSVGALQGSIDGALSLRRAHFPSLVLMIALTSDGQAEIREAWDADGDYDQCDRVVTGHPAIAILIALFEALKAREADGSDLATAVRTCATCFYARKGINPCCNKCMCFGKNPPLPHWLPKNHALNGEGS